MTLMAPKYAEDDSNDERDLAPATHNLSKAKFDQFMGESKQRDYIAKP